VVPELHSARMGILERIKDIELELSRTQKNKVSFESASSCFVVLTLWLYRPRRATDAD